MNLFYDYFHQALANGHIRLLDDEIRAVLLAPDYSYGSTHRRLSNIAGWFVDGVDVVTVQNVPVLAGKAFLASPTTGQQTVFDADDVVFATLTADTEAGYVALYDQTAESLGRDSLICVIEFGETKVPNHVGNIFLSWSEFGIFDVGVGENTGGIQHGHTNKVYLTYIDQALNKTASPSFSSVRISGRVSVGSIGGIDDAPFSLAGDLELNGHTIDGVASVADDAEVVHLAGVETVSGQKTFSAAPSVPTPTNDAHAANKAYVDAKRNTWDGAAGGFTLNWAQTLDAGAIRLVPSGVRKLSLLDKDDALVAIEAAGMASDVTVLGWGRPSTYAGLVGFGAANGIAAGGSRPIIAYDLATDSWKIGNGVDWIGLADDDHAHEKADISDFSEEDYVHARPADPLQPERVSGVKYLMQPRAYLEYPVWQPGAQYTFASTPKVWRYDAADGSYELYDLVDEHTSVGPTMDDDSAHWSVSADQGSPRRLAFADGTQDDEFGVALGTSKEAKFSAIAGDRLAGGFVTRHSTLVFGKLYRFPPEDEPAYIPKNSIVYDRETNTLYRTPNGVNVLDGERRGKMNPGDPEYDPGYVFYLYDPAKAVPVACAQEWSAAKTYFANELVWEPSSGYGDKAALFLCVDDDSGAGITGVQTSDASHWTSISASDSEWAPNQTLDTSDQAVFVVPEEYDVQAYVYRYVDATPTTVDNVPNGQQPLSWAFVSPRFEKASVNDIAETWEQARTYAVGDYVKWSTYVPGSGFFPEAPALYRVAVAHTSSSVGTPNDDFETDILAGNLVRVPLIDSLLQTANDGGLGAPVVIDFGDEWVHVHRGEKYAGSYAYSLSPTTVTGAFFDDDEAEKWVLSLNPHMQNVYVGEYVHFVVSHCDAPLNVLLDEQAFDGFVTNVKAAAQPLNVYPAGPLAYIDGLYNSAAPLALDTYDNMTLLSVDGQMYIL